MADDLSSAGITSGNPEEFPDFLLKGSLRKALFGLGLPQNASQPHVADPQSLDRVQDDPETRHNVRTAPSGGTAPLEGESLGIPTNLADRVRMPSRIPRAAIPEPEPVAGIPPGSFGSVGMSPEVLNPTMSQPAQQGGGQRLQQLIDQLQAQYNQGNQPRQPMTLKQRIMGALPQLLSAAPGIALAATGHPYAATGALQGDIAAWDKQRAQRDWAANQQRENQARTLQELTGLYKTQEQEEAATGRERIAQDAALQRRKMQEEAENARAEAQGRGFAQQQSMEKMKEEARRTEDQISAQQASQLNSNYDSLARKYGLPPGQFSPGMSRQEATQLMQSLNAVVTRDQGATRISMEGPKQLAIQPDGKVVELRPGMTVAPGTTTLAGEAAAQKTSGGAKAAVEYANDYLARGVFSGPGDEALQEKFFELAKPSSGFRMTQPQMQMLRNSRGWLSGLGARARHATVGTWFSDQQRQQIVSTMNDILKANISAKGGRGESVQPQQQGVGLSNFHVNPQTGERIGWDGKQWVSAPAR